MKCTCVFVILLVGGVGCSAVPQSVRAYAANLPNRANGQYNLVDDSIKKSLVTQDASLQCAIDVEDKKKEEDSAACKCFKSAFADWISDCKPWLGDHTPSSTGSNAPNS